MNPRHVWLIWSSAFLIPWTVLFIAFPSHRTRMWWASLLTAPFGLSEPIFVPEYWNPPSLFDLAQTTGFDIESLIFCFAIGGVGVVLYDTVTGGTVAHLSRAEAHHGRHRWHRVAIASPLMAFVPLYLLPWNPIYAGIGAMLVGAVAAIACRPDLGLRTLLGGGLFFVYYLAFMLALLVSAPGYIEQVWNLTALSGLTPAGIPLEELLFGFTFGMYWSSVYEHLTWTRTTLGSRHSLDPSGPEGGVS